jgi:hypothetical protein
MDTPSNTLSCWNRNDGEDSFHVSGRPRRATWHMDSGMMQDEQRMKPWKQSVHPMIRMGELSGLLFTSFRSHESSSMQWAESHRSDGYTDDRFPRNLGSEVRDEVRWDFFRSSIREKSSESIPLYLPTLEAAEEDKVSILYKPMEESKRNGPKASPSTTMQNLILEDNLRVGLYSIIYYG